MGMTVVSTPPAALSPSLSSSSPSFGEYLLTVVRFRFDFRSGGMTTVSCMPAADTDGFRARALCCRKFFGATEALDFGCFPPPPFLLGFFAFEGFEAALAARPEREFDADEPRRLVPPRLGGRDSGDRERDRSVDAAGDEGGAARPL